MPDVDKKPVLFDLAKRFELGKNERETKRERAQNRMNEKTMQQTFNGGCFQHT